MQDKDLRVKDDGLMLSGTKRFDKTELVSIIVHSLPKHHREHMSVSNMLPFCQGIDFFGSISWAYKAWGWTSTNPTAVKRRPPTLTENGSKIKEAAASSRMAKTRAWLQRNTVTCACSLATGTSGRTTPNSAA